MEKDMILDLDNESLMELLFELEQLDGICAKLTEEESVNNG